MELPLRLKLLSNALTKCSLTRFLLIFRLKTRKLEQKIKLIENSTNLRFLLFYKLLYLYT